MTKQTYAVMDVPPDVYYWIRNRLEDAGYQHAIDDQKVMVYLDQIVIQPNFELSNDRAKIVELELIETKKQLERMRSAVRAMVESDEEVAKARAAMKRGSNNNGCGSQPEQQENETRNSPS